MNARVGLVIGQLGHGGAERQLYLLATGLADAGVDLHVYCLSEEVEPYGPLLETAGVPLRVISRAGSYDPRRALKLAGALREDGVELVHAFLESATVYAWLATRKYRRPILLPSLRSLPVKQQLVKHFLLGRALRAAPLVTANSRAGAAAYAVKFGLSPETMRVAPNGVRPVKPVSAEERLAARRRFGVSERGPVIGTVGKPDPDKNIPAFLRLVKGAGEATGGVCSLIAGRGMDEAYAVRQDARRHSTCEMFFLGELDDMRPFYAAIDLLVLTSLREGMPNALLEAAAHGVAEVAFAAGGIGEAVDNGRTGMLVEPADEPALLQAALVLLNDEERRREMGRAARELVTDKFGVERMVAAVRDVYAELLPPG